jgi:hypothetical protein
MTVVRGSNGTFDVVSGCKVVESGFPTMAAAWRWIDRYDGEPISPAEKRTAWIVDKMLRGDRS